MSAKKTVGVAAVLAACTFAQGAYTVTKIQWWRSMEGALNDKVNEVTTRFNASQSDYKTVPVYKDQYDESLAVGITALRVDSAPAILRAFEVGTVTTTSAKGAIMSVTKIMKDADEKFDPKTYVSTVAGYHAPNRGEMLFFPFNSSVMIMYYSKDAFKEAGLGPGRPPAMWQEVAVDMAKLKVVGVSCGYTTDQQLQVYLESFSTRHNVSFATESNGFDGARVRSNFSGPMQIKHIENLLDTQKKGYFTYVGCKGGPRAKSIAGECAMCTGSSAALTNIRKNTKFDLSPVSLPYEVDVPGALQDMIIGGTSLWVMGGHKAEEYKGMAKFFPFLSRPEMQADWHQSTGYLPVTLGAYELTKKSGLYEENPGADVAIKQMIIKTTDKSRGIHLGNFPQIRQVTGEEPGSVWAGKKASREALDVVVSHGNKLLVRFEKTVKE